MRISFDSIGLEGFKSFTKATVLDLRERGPGLHFIRGANKQEPRLGSNGAGKSTIWDALCWCLYGKTPSGLRNTDVRPWKGPKQTTVVVRGRIDDEEFEIARTANPNSLQLNGKEKDDISKFLGLSYEVFTNTVLMGQGQPLFFDLQPRQKMDLFVDVLDLDRWDVRAKKASERAADLELDKATDEGELTGLESSREQVESLLETTRKRAEEWDSERKSRHKALVAKRDEYQLELDQVLPKRHEADLGLESASMRAKEIRADLVEFREAYFKARRELDKANAVIGGYEGEASKLSHQLKLIGETGRCPVCDSPIKGTKLGAHRAELSTKLADFRLLVEKGPPASVVKASKAAHKKVEEFERLEEEAQADIDKWQTQLNVHGPRAAELEAKIKATQSLMDDSEQMENPHRSQVSNLTRKRTSLTEQIAEKTAAIQKLAARIERTQFWVKGFKNVRLYVIEEVLTALQLTTNAVLEDMGLVDWQVSYDIERETKSGTIQRGLNVTILSPTNRSPVKWESWSGGEGQRLRLVGALALSEVLLHYAGVEVDLEILDEPTRGLSDEGVSDLCEFLADRADALERQIFYVDHMVVESTRFASVLTVVKSKEGSVLK